MRNLKRFSCYSILFIYKRIALLLLFLLHFQFSTIAQSPSEKLLHCAWEDLAITSFYKNDPVVLKIKSDPDYKEWTRYSGRPLILESFENGSLVFSLTKKKKLRIPTAGVESLQLIKANSKKVSGLQTAGGVLSALGIIFFIASRVSRNKESDSFTETTNNAASSCLSLLLGIIFFVIGIVLFLSGSNPKVPEQNKLGKEVSFDNPRCKCEWTAYP